VHSVVTMHAWGSQQHNERRFSQWRGSQQQNGRRFGGVASSTTADASLNGGVASSRTPDVSPNGGVASSTTASPNGISLDLQGTKIPKSWSVGWTLPKRSRRSTEPQKLVDRPDILFLKSETRLYLFLRPKSVHWPKKNPKVGRSTGQLDRKSPKVGRSTGQSKSKKLDSSRSTSTRLSVHLEGCESSSLRTTQHESSWLRTSQTRIKVVAHIAT
jgi:hypothetical protein